MTEDGWRMLTHIQFEVAQVELRKPSMDAARAAASAMLDAMDAYADELPVSWPRTIREFTADIREELGLERPAEPAQRDKPISGTQPQDS